MNTRQKIAACGIWLSVSMVHAQTPADTARKAMETSVARQRQAVAAMRLSIARQRTAAVGTPPASAPAPLSDSDFELSWPALGPGCDPLPEERLAPLLTQAAQKEGLDTSLLRAVVEQESGFRPCALSPRGAMGLMQLMPSTAAELGVEDPFDPQQNLLSGARFLKQLLDRFGGDAALALSAYNAGPERVEQANGVPPIPETIHYVERILSRLPIP
jgi:soluble lytic murein transglycosylase-like protein